MVKVSKYLIKSRGNDSQLYYKKAVLKTFKHFTEKKPMQEPLLK